MCNEGKERWGSKAAASSISRAAGQEGRGNQPCRRCKHTSPHFTPRPRSSWTPGPWSTSASTGACRALRRAPPRCFAALPFCSFSLFFFFFYTFFLFFAGAAPVKCCRGVGATPARAGGRAGCHGVALAPAGQTPPPCARVRPPQPACVVRRGPCARSSLLRLFRFSSGHMLWPMLLEVDTCASKFIASHVMPAEPG